MNVQEHEQKLIALVEEYRDRECSELLEQARKTKQEMIRTAYRDARQHLHQAVERERAHAISRVRSAEAELHTKRRAVEQRVAESFLKEGWLLLRERLLKRWQGSESRLTWIDRCAVEAMKRLPLGQWVVQHPVDCRPEELAYFSNQITKRSEDIVIDMRVASEIEAGLVIGTSNTYLDMSLEGLFKDSESIEARMLALLNRSKEE
jgi:hypothetical protein